MASVLAHLFSAYTAVEQGSTKTQPAFGNLEPMQQTDAPQNNGCKVLTAETCNINQAVHVLSNLLIGDLPPTSPQPKANLHSLKVSVRYQILHPKIHMSTLSINPKIRADFMLYTSKQLALSDVGLGCGPQVILPGRQAVGGEAL